MDKGAGAGVPLFLAATVCSIVSSVQYYRLSMATANLRIYGLLWCISTLRLAPRAYKIGCLSVSATNVAVNLKAIRSRGLGILRLDSKHPYPWGMPMSKYLYNVLQRYFIVQRQWRNAASHRPVFNIHSLARCFLNPVLTLKRTAYSLD